MPNQPRLIKDEQTPDTVSADKVAYRERLRQCLQDPAFLQIEVFSLGADEDILALSDPPYYTACPNPFLPEFMEQWQAERAALRQKLGLNVGQAVSLPGQTDSLSYHREPFAADVSEGKNDPIYNAHSCQTKVPHKAIMRFTLHYTDLEKLRRKSLLREFNDYRAGGKKLKQFRTEAVRAGFAHAWQNKEYALIIQVCDCLPEQVLQEDPDLLMYYDNASLLA
jgi:hypothetical protein